MAPEEPSAGLNTAFFGCFDPDGSTGSVGSAEEGGPETAESWAERLAGVPTTVEIPSDRPRPHHGGTSDEQLRLELSGAASRAVRERSRALRVAPSAFLLAALGLTLGRMTGADTLLVGFPSPTGSLLPVRVDIDDASAPGAFVSSVHKSLARSLRTGRAQLPQFTDAPDGDGSRVDLSVHFDQDEPCFVGRVEYTTGLWTRAEAQRFAADYLAAVEQLAEAAAWADTALADVRCISRSGIEVLTRINRTGEDFPSSSLDELFRAEAARRPDAVAVRDADSVLTYSELAAAAAEQARRLRAVGVADGDAVLIGVQRSVAEAVAVLGALWAGAAYVGVDLTQPAAHTARIVAKAAPTAAVVGADQADSLARHGLPVVGPWQPEWDLGGGQLPPAAADPDRVAYIAFTSGSTGEPKGVAVPHRGVIRLVHDADYLMLGPAERVLRLSPLAFDASTFELWGALLSGAALEVCPPGLVAPGELGAFIEERRVTVAWLTAGLFRLVQEFAPASLGGLRQLLSGGDVVPHEHVARALADHPGLTVTNGYGPTENTTFTTFHSVRSPELVDGPLPIGTPVPGTRVYVLDRRARLLAPGAVGELYTGGEGLALGYVGDREETNRCFGFFSPDVPERLYRTGDLARIDRAGRLCFLGRADQQVKVRGYRIELGAITDALNNCPEVEDSVVTVTDGTTSDKRLLAAVRLAPGSTITPVALRDRLSEQLPSFMVPSLWAVVDRMPVTANGKVDRLALAAAALPANAFGRKKNKRQDTAG
jgi:amino acid adenylation domain-containing protein